MPDASLGGRDTHTTIRTIMDAQKIAHPKGDFRDSWSEQRRCDGCNRYWPCDDYNRAVAALAQLDAAEVGFLDEWGDDPCRLVPGPVAGSPGAPRSNT